MLLDSIKNLGLWDENQLKGASKEQLTSMFNQLTNVKNDIATKNMNLRVSLETKQNERGNLLKTIQDKYSVNSIEELDVLRQGMITKISDLSNKLKGLLQEEPTGNVGV